MEILRMYEQTLQQANILRVAAGTTGEMGGDGGHGGMTIFEIDGGNSTCMEVKTDGDRCVRLEFAGDSEMDTIIEGLEFIVNTLKRERDRNGNRR
jgi:hypothetical protein